MHAIRPPRRRLLPSRSLAFLGLALLAGCGPSAKPAVDSPPQASSASEAPVASPPPAAPSPKPAPAAPYETTFLELGADIGLDFTYASGARGQLLMVEAMGGGAGWLDVDGDQLWDLYLPQGGDPVAGPNASQPNDRLFRLTRDRHFVDITDQAFIDERFYSQGVTIADFDADGFDDIYVANVGRNTLWQNQGDGTFRDVSASAGVGDERWSVSCAWADLDGDDDLDLYVGNYCVYDPRNPIDCTKNGAPHICHPIDVEGAPDECYLNQGDGTFRAAARERGLFGKDNRALGVVAADFDNDGDIDLYVANDMAANFLFVNDGQGKFQESAVLLGCAYDRNGNAQASMGLACGDFDANGFLDLYSTHFQFDSNTLYQNLGSAGFQDVTGIMGLHGPTLPMLGFGTVMLDLDRDGQVELVIANGHIEPTIVQSQTVFEMPAQLFRYNGKRFEEVSQQAGAFFQKKLLGRGIAACDFDDDGDLDLCYVPQNASAALLRNEAAKHHWIAFRLRGAGLNRRAINARVTVECGGRQWMQELCGGTSYASSQQPILFFGLGDASAPVSATIRWPNGREQRLENLPLNQKHEVSAP
ncbi:MAG: CRTAC1 family protein [Pirellulales bacterium]